jgi:hypothetical protein
MTDAVAEAAPTEPVSPVTTSLITEPVAPAEKLAAPAADAAPVAEAAPTTTPFDPVTYAPPEGLSLSPEDKTQLGEIASKYGLPSEAVTDLLGVYKTKVESASEAPVKAFLELNDRWQAEVKADKEIGGEKLPAVLQSIGKLLDDPRYANPDLKAALTYTGAGNHPAIIKAFYKMSQALTEGGHVGGEPPRPAAKPLGAQAMYPNLPTGG